MPHSYVVGMADQGCAIFAVERQVPQPHAVIRIAGGEQGAVGAKGDAEHAIGLSGDAE